VKVSVTFLKYKENLKKVIDELEETNAEFLHVDVMDGKFVPPVVLTVPEIKEHLMHTKKPLDVHLMVEEPKEYIDLFANCHTEFITIHAELNQDIRFLIDYIHSKGIKAGIAIKSETTIESIKAYLEVVDYVLIMGIIPGYGGQKMIPETVSKIHELKMLRDENKYHYVISFDGGINKETRPLLDELDIMAVGSFITMSDDMQESINIIR